MFDAKQFLIDYNIPYKTEGQNCQEGWVNVMCPVCPSNDPDRNFHGGFNEMGDYYHCWRCGGRSIGWVVGKLLNCSYDEARTIVDDYQFGTVREKRTIEKKEFVLPGERLKDIHMEYLISRGFDPYHIIRKYRVRGTDWFGELANRLVIPIIYNGQAVSYQARDVSGRSDRDSECPRYMNCPLDREIVPSKSILYGLDYCGDWGILVEGMTDVWRGGDNFCASFGTEITSEQKKLIMNRFWRLFIAFDPEPTAQKKAESLAMELSLLGVQTYVVDPEECDIGDMNEDQLRRFIDKINYLC